MNRTFITFSILNSFNSILGEDTEFDEMLQNGNNDSSSNVNSADPTIGIMTITC